MINCSYMIIFSKSYCFLKTLAQQPACFIYTFSKHLLSVSFNRGGAEFGALLKDTYFIPGMK